jgi:hypothetical protein
MGKGTNFKKTENKTPAISVDVVAESSDQIESAILDQPEVEESSDEAENTTLDQPEVEESSDEAESATLDQPEVEETSDEAENTTLDQPEVEEPSMETIQLMRKHLDQVKSVFESNATEKMVLLTSDGQVFLKKDRSSAENHARKDGRMKRDKALVILEVPRSIIE